MKKYFVLAVGCVTVFLVMAMAGKKDPATEAELGRMLFFDPILSRDKKISCASCHKPAYAFADTTTVSVGFRGRKGSRNTPSAMNLLLQKPFLWDGRAGTLEEQALEPIKNPLEMNLPVAKAVVRLRNSKKYSDYFQKIFGSEPDSISLAKSLAAFERTLETSDSPFDQWKFEDDSSAVTEAAKRGFVVFSGKGKCTKCHFGSNFTTNEFRNIGLFDGKKLNDTGRAVITGKAEDIGKFKTPALRNVAVTAPYMHNGMFKTLKEVINFYDKSAQIIPGSVNKDTLMPKTLGLTRQEKRDLESFLRSLTDKKFAVTARNRRR